MAANIKSLAIMSTHLVPLFHNLALDLVDFILNDRTDVVQGIDPPWLKNPWEISFCKKQIGVHFFIKNEYPIPQYGAEVQHRASVSLPN